MKAAVGVKKSTKSIREVLVVYVDGAGQGPFRTGSSYACVVKNTGRSWVKHVDGLTNNQAEYRAVILALKRVPDGSELMIFCDSQIVVFQFNGQYQVYDPKLKKLLRRVRELIRERHLTVTMMWIPSEENEAHKLLSKSSRKEVR